MLFGEAEDKRRTGTPAAYSAENFGTKLFLAAADRLFLSAASNMCEALKLTARIPEKVRRLRFLLAQWPTAIDPTTNDLPYSGVRAASGRLHPSTVKQGA